MLNFDGISSFSAKPLKKARSSEFEGGVEGGVPNSSEDEEESTYEEVSETREGVRETVEKSVLCTGAAGVGVSLCLCD